MKFKCKPHRGDIMAKIKLRNLKLKVHVSKPLRLIHKALQIMLKNRSGIIINVSSLAACFPTAWNAMYSSTKSFPAREKNKTRIGMLDEALGSS